MTCRRISNHTSIRAPGFPSSDPASADRCGNPTCPEPTYPFAAIKVEARMTYGLDTCSSVPSSEDVHKQIAGRSLNNGVHARLSLIVVAFGYFPWPFGN